MFQVITGERRNKIGERTTTPNIVWLMETPRHRVERVRPGMGRRRTGWKACTNRFHCDVKEALRVKGGGRTESVERADLQQSQSVYITNLCIKPDYQKRKDACVRSSSPTPRSLLTFEQSLVPAAVASGPTRCRRTPPPSPLSTTTTPAPLFPPYPTPRRSATIPKTQAGCQRN